MAQLVARPLELPPNVYLRSIESHIWPGETERFAPAEPENEDQHEGCVQRVIVAAGGLQEGPCFLDGPPLPLAFPRSGEPNDGGDIAGNQLLRDGVGQRSPEGVAHVFY